MKGREAAGKNLVAFKYHGAETEMQVGMKFNSLASQFSLFSRRINDKSVQYKANITTQNTKTLQIKNKTINKKRQKLRNNQKQNNKQNTKTLQMNKNKTIYKTKNITNKLKQNNKQKTVQIKTKQYTKRYK
jgi:hypothetical protein